MQYSVFFMQWTEKNLLPNLNVWEKKYAQFYFKKLPKKMWENIK